MLYGSAMIAHASSMASALLLFGMGELLWVPASRGWPRPARLALRARRVAGVLATIGVVSGIVLLLMGGWPLGTPWLLASFVIIATLMLVERKFIQPWEVRARLILREDASPVEVKALAGEKRALLGRIAMILLFATVGALMVAKPALSIPVFVN